MEIEVTVGCRVISPVEHQTFWGLVAARATLSPDQSMLIDANDRTITFGEFKQRAENVARAFQQLGVGSGTTVAWQLPTRIETAILIAALARLDAIQVPMVPLYREREVGFLLRETQPRVCLTPGTWRGFDYFKMVTELTRGSEDAARIINVHDALPESSDGALSAPADSNEQTRWIFSTSGTTSLPKGVCHTDRSVIAAAEVQADSFALREDDRHSIIFPLAHGGGPVSLAMVLIQGITTVCVETFERGPLIELFRRHDVTIAGAGLTAYLAYIDEQRRVPERKLLPRLRLLHGGGGPMPPSVYYEAKKVLGVPVLHHWGMTEGLCLSQSRVSDSDEQLANTVGLPGRDVEIRVRMDDGSEAGANVQGEIHVRGPMMFRGYTDPKLTADNFTLDGFFRTGDVGYLREDGRIVIAGRSKDIIIRKGENISALEVENVIYEHGDVAEVAVIALPDRERGELACAVVVPKPGATITFDGIVEHCRSANLATFKIPERLHIVASLPRNAMMKVLKQQLRTDILRQSGSA